MPLRPLLLVVALLGASGCVESDLTFTADRPRSEPGAEANADPDAVVAAALEDLEAYWAEALPEVYDVEFEGLRGGYVPFGPGTPLPRCGDAVLDYAQIADNALYCPSDDLIAWDRTTLVPDLQARFGALTVGMVMAHEFAHAVQARGGVEGATVTLELQADCFAGAWVDDVDDRIGTFATGGDALDRAVAGLLELRDTLGVPGSDPMAHGSGFDRVGAFQDGFEQGLEACARYEDEPPPVAAIPFGGLDDRLTGGNLPLEELVEPLSLDLDAWFGALVTDHGGDWERVEDLVLFDPTDGPVTCGPVEVARDELVDAAFHCATDDVHYLDGVGLVPSLTEIGDYAFAGEVARLHAFAAQAQLGLDGDRADEGLHADCLAGAFAGAQFDGEIPPVPDESEDPVRGIEDGLRPQQLHLSPGDLDEIVIAFLSFDAGWEARAFDRIGALRRGFVDGAAACETYLA